MNKFRTCDSAQLFTGVTKCPIDFGKMIGAIIVAEGAKLPKDITAEALEKLAHADPSERIYGLYKFVEYAKSGGEAQTSVVGYGPEQPNGFSARKDTFTMIRFYPELHASLTRTSHVPRGAYFYDENGWLYGLDDGTDVLAPFPMATIYSDATPHPTSSAKSSMTVTFAFDDPKKAIEEFNYVALGFHPQNLTLGLNQVKLQKVDEESSKYKIVEKVGGYDLTGLFGPLVTENGTDIFPDASAVTYNSADKTIPVKMEAGKSVSLAAPEVLYEKGIKGIEQVA